MIPPENVPLVPPPPVTKVQTAPPTSIPATQPRSASLPPPLPPPPTSTTGPSQPLLPPPRKKTRRFRRFLLFLFLLGGLSFAGGTYYSLVSDNFHDFFTEYIPFGEDAVLYFEEREFRRRFPRITNPTHRPAQENKITIPSRSGLSWKIADVQDDGSDLATKGRHMSALDANKPKPGEKDAQQTPAIVKGKEKVKAVVSAKQGTPTKPAPSKPTSTPVESSSKVPTKVPEVDEPSIVPPEPSKSPEVDEPNVAPPRWATGTEDASIRKPDVDVSSVAPPKLADSSDKTTKKSPEVDEPNVSPSGKNASSEATPKKSPEVDEPSVAPPRPAKKTSKMSPEVDEPSVPTPIPRIDPLSIKDADEPVVQDLVKMVNDIITVVNGDKAAGKYSSSINKAKSDLASVGNKILALKEAERAAAEEKIKATQSEFDKAAKELVRRLEEEMRNQESQWKDEFESERDKISESYKQRLDSELERAQKVLEQKHRNELLEQALALKKYFLSEVTSHVETERNGRLSKLSDLSTSVSELEKLTSEWNSVIDANLKTQHLQVAVEAVRASLESANRPRPFIKELAALKELADNDPVINAAIASINPTAYQRGVPTSAQLIDRFRRVAAEVRKASLLPEDAGVASHAASWALSKILFKKQGLAVGDDVESVLTRTETLLEEGELDLAAREMNTLSGWAKNLSQDWLGECRRVLEVRQALDVSFPSSRFEVDGLGLRMGANSCVGHCNGDEIAGFEG